MDAGATHIAWHLPGHLGKSQYTWSLQSEIQIATTLCVVSIHRQLLEMKSLPMEGACHITMEVFLKGSGIEVLIFLLLRIFGSLKFQGESSHK